MSNSRARYVSSVANSAPIAKNDKKTEKLLHNFKNLQKITWKKLINYIFSRIPFQWMGVKPSDFLLAGGEKTIKHCVSVPTDKSTKILWVHSLDYDRYLEEKRKDSGEHETAVFLDEYVPFHPDYVHAGAEAPVSADRYYSQLNNFFKLIEDRLGFEVIIALHPRSNYEARPDYFDGRKCVRGETARLIKMSKLVLAHNSTALSLANLFYKPVIFLTSFELDKSWMGSRIRCRAGWFAKKPIFINKPDTVDWVHELTISKNTYHDYRQAYIKKDESLDLPFWQIVADRLRAEKPG